MKAAGPDHSNILLIIVVASVLGICFYVAVLWFGGWRALIGLFGISLLVWLLLIALGRWPEQ